MPGKLKLQLDAEKIVNLARVGTSTRDIAALMGCDEGTLRKPEWFVLINKARAERRAALHKMQWDSAKGVAGTKDTPPTPGNVTMQIWLGKNELGQTDKQTVEHTGGVSFTLKIGPKIQPSHEHNGDRISANRSAAL